jgi:hypothetical protein
MDGSDEGVSTAVFSARLDELFRTRRGPDGRLYSVRQAAAELTRRGQPVSHTYLGRLRNGTAAPPRTSMVEALAALFGVGVDYFAVPAGEASTAEAFATRQALADPEIRRVALRLLEAKLSPEGADAVLSMIDHVRRLEEAARRNAQASARQP